MRRWICTNRSVKGDPAVLEVRLREDAAELFADAAAADGDPAALEGAVPEVEVDGAQLLRLGARLAGISAETTVRLRTGVASRRGSRTVIPVSWEPVHGKAVLPTFKGTIELTPLDRANAELTLVGSYAVPLGPVGAAFDAAGLRGIAERTAEGLLAGVAAGLGERARHAATAPAAEARPAGEPLRVADVMSEDPLTLLEDLPVRTAALLLFHIGVSGAPVVRADGELVGVLSERDLLDKEALPPERLGRAGAASARRRDARTVGEACSRPAASTVPDASLREAARVMAERDIARLVVVDESRVAGIVTRHDVLQALLRSDAELQEAVEAVLRSRGDRDVRATVTWGIVDVDGQVELRSEVDRLLRALREVDGVVDVEGAPTWRTDDVLPAGVGVPL